MTEEHNMEETFVEQPEPSKEEVIVKPAQPGNKLIMILIFILFAGLLGIYLLFFLKKDTSPKVPAAALYHKAGGITVAFVNSDSIKSKYMMVKEMQKTLEQKFASLDGDVRVKQQALESKASELQQKYDAHLITQEEAAKQQDYLQTEGKKLYDLNQQYSARMADEENKMNNIFIDSIDNYLKRYNQMFNFDYILGYSRGGGILFAKDTLDITEDVLKGLNEEYLKKSKK